ncbi:MAG: hypothetical protein QXQ81_10465 [Candidatus Thorarchaeota archaeon]
MITVYYPYVLSLKAPVILPRIGGDPSSAQTLDYIPGSAVRGAVGRGLKDADREIVERILLSGAVRYLNAYPFVSELRLLPVPLSLYADKHESDEGHAYDLASGNSPLEKINSPVRFTGHYVSFISAPTIRTIPRMKRRVHHLRDREAGYPHGKDEAARGTVFSNEYLEEDQEFCGIVQVRADTSDSAEALVNQLKSVLGECVLLGRSKRGGYGGVASIRWLDRCVREIEMSGNVVKFRVSSGQRFRAVLLSDYVGRNQKTGQNDPHWLLTEIVEALDNRVKICDVYCQTGLVGGYNRKWGTEIPQLYVMARGTTVVLEALDGVSEKEIADVENQGLGEKLVEGYGRVVFLELGPEELDFDVPQPQIRPMQGDKAPDLLERIWKSVIREKLEKIAVLQAIRMVRTTRNSMSNSLIGRLRTILELPESQALQQLEDLLGKEDRQGKPKLRSTARKQLESSTVKRLYDERKISMREFLHSMAQSARQKKKEGEAWKTLNVSEVLSEHRFPDRIAEEAVKDSIEKVTRLFLDSFLSTLSKAKDVS